MSPEPNLFPLGVATGSAHCNRKEERAELTGNVLTGAHTWLWGRRRTGKTSLVEQVLQDLAGGRRKVVAAAIDLLVVHDAQDLEARLRAAVERLGARMVPKGRKSSGKLAEAFGALKPEFSFGAMGLGVRLSPPVRPVQGIAEMLLGLDQAAGLYRRRAVVVLDEFQQLGQLKSGAAGHGPEGAVRHAVERARNVTYLFAGSQRHLLASMFEDEDRPLYRLCRKMTLDRIGAADYRAFIRRACRGGATRSRTPPSIGSSQPPPGTPTTSTRSAPGCGAAIGPLRSRRSRPLGPGSSTRTSASPPAGWSVWPRASAPC